MPDEDPDKRDSNTPLVPSDQPAEAKKEVSHQIYGGEEETG